MRFFLGAKARYTCTWQCTRCGRENREKGEVRTFARIYTNGFTDDAMDEMEIAGERVEEKACKRLYELQTQVNDHGFLLGLRVSGLCRGCGQRQSWSPAWRHAWACAAAIGTLAALLWLLGIPSDGMAWLTLLAVTGGAAVLAEAIGVLAASWQVGRMAEECRPWVKERFPMAEEFTPWLEDRYMK